MSKVEVQEDGLIPIFTAVYLVNPVIDIDNKSALFAISPFHVTYQIKKKISLQLSFAPKIKSIALVDPSKSLRKVGGKRF